MRVLSLCTLCCGGQGSAPRIRCSVFASAAWERGATSRIHGGRAGEGERAMTSSRRVSEFRKRREALRDRPG